MPKSITRKLPLSTIKQVEGFEHLTDEHVNSAHVDHVIPLHRDQSF